MTTEELAIAVCGAMGPCPEPPVPVLEFIGDGIRVEKSYHNPHCPRCGGTEKVYVLGDGARRECPVLALEGKDVEYGEGHRVHPQTCARCHNRLWLENILLLKEPCPACPGQRGLHAHINQQGVGPPRQCACPLCGGLGTIRRVDEGLLREELEKVGYEVRYTGNEWVVWKSKERNPLVGQDARLLEAAVKALG